MTDTASGTVEFQPASVVSAMSAESLSTPQRNKLQKKANALLWETASVSDREEADWGYFVDLTPSNSGSYFEQTKQKQQQHQQYKLQNEQKTQSCNGWSPKLDFGGSSTSSSSSLLKTNSATDAYPAAFSKETKENPMYKACSSTSWCSERLSNDLLFSEISDPTLDVLDDIGIKPATKLKQSDNKSGGFLLLNDDKNDEDNEQKEKIPMNVSHASTLRGSTSSPRAITRHNRGSHDENYTRSDNNQKGKLSSELRVEHVAAQVAAAVAAVAGSRNAETTTPDISLSPKSKSIGKQFAIPRVQIGQDGNVQYLVTLSEPGKTVRQKWTRFSSFHELKDKIKLALPRNVVASFPKRYWKWFVKHSTNKFVENRRGALESWLRQSVDFLSSHNHLYTQHFSYFASWLNKFREVN